MAYSDRPLALLSDELMIALGLRKLAYLKVSLLNKIPIGQ
jgi:hypothetical protein